jgi:CHASE2 domain-containing sensor protein
MDQPASVDVAPPARVPRHKRSFRRDALWALVIVVLLEGLTLGAETTSWWERYSWPFHDLFMRTWRGQDIDPATARPLAFLDIDDAAFRRWGGSGVTNRARLRDLIRYAAGGGASLVVVDVDLSYPDLTQGSGDAALLDWLRDYHSGPNLIFARALSPPPPNEPTAWQAQGSLLEPIVANNPLVHFATAVFTMDADSTVRRWRLWEKLCDNDKPVALPSVELLTVMLVDDPVHGARKLDGVLAATLPDKCDQVEHPLVDRLRFTHFPELSLFPDPHGEEILFTQPWPVLGWVEHRLVYLPALVVREKDPSTDPVKDRIVVIGGSNAASRDFVQTPIGIMPGAMVLLNSINALMQQGQLSHPPWWLGLGVGVALGMGVWFILYTFQFPIALILAAAFVCVVTWLVASCLVGYGIWLDMAVPSFAMFFHRWWSVMETIVHEWKTYGLRALMTERFRRPLMLVLIAGLAAACTTVARADPVVAGHISAMDGDAQATFMVERGGDRIPARYWANVFDGDRIVVTGNGRLEIAPDGQVVTAANSPATIKAARPATPVQVFGERFGWILSQFGEQARATPQLISRSIPGPLAVPLLSEPDHQRIVAGTRKLILAWVGGTPGFTTTIATAAGTLTMDRAANNAPGASKLLQLGAGHYDVTVTDHAGTDHAGTDHGGTSVLAHIDVVQSLPALDEAGMAGAPDDVRKVMEAVQLAKIDGGHWRLEAFLRLTDAGVSQGIARLLSDRLAAGRSLDDPSK